MESKIKSDLISWGQYKIVERERLNDILGEQKFGLLGLTEDKVVELGKMLGSSVIIIGGVTDFSQEDVYLEYRHKGTEVANLDL